MPRQPKHVGNLTLQQKKKICEWSAAHPHLTQRELALKAQRELALLKQPTQGAICNILKRKETFMRATDAQLQRRRTATLAHAAVDDALANWVHQCQAWRISLSGDLLKAKTRRIEELLDTPNDLCLRFSNGWLQAFQARHGFKSLKMHAPDKTIASRQIQGSKKSKVRVTVALTCNADGSDMREPFIIGHAMKPRCFEKKSGADLGFYYRSNNKALMASVIFREWLHELDVDMEQQRR
ncbi:hypothetical protein PC110_g15044, partial [Phytophthora cactorum]